MRETWRQEPWEWWLKYRVRLDAHVRLPSIRPDSAAVGGRPLGTAIGTLVHRLLEMPSAYQKQAPPSFRQLLEAMAAGLLFAPSPCEGTAEEESSVLVDVEMVRVVADAVEQIWRRLQGAKADGKQVCALLQAAGETEVPFVLKLGRWQLSGRYDKLLATDDGYEIVDWKTDQDDEIATIAQRHASQLRLYALALHRAGRAAFVDGKVRVHLAMFHPLHVQTLHFAPADLEAFADALELELQQMDAYDP
jgi:ATP-dependent exoDNAse (exonuclease V) beta subunit